MPRLCPNATRACAAHSPAAAAMMCVQRMLHGLHAHVTMRWGAYSILGSAAQTHRTLLSQLPDTMVRPSGLMATLLTQLVWPVSVVRQSPDAASHTLQAPCMAMCGGVWRGVRCGQAAGRHPHVCSMMQHSCKTHTAYARSPWGCTREGSRHGRRFTAWATQCRQCTHMETAGGDRAQTGRRQGGPRRDQGRGVAGQRRAQALS